MQKAERLVIVSEALYQDRNIAKVVDGVRSINPDLIRVLNASQIGDYILQHRPKQALVCIRGSSRQLSVIRSFVAQMRELATKNQISIVIACFYAEGDMDVIPSDLISVEEIGVHPIGDFDLVLNQFIGKSQEAKKGGRIRIEGLESSEPKSGEEGKKTRPLLRLKKPASEEQAPEKPGEPDVVSEEPTRTPDEAESEGKAKPRQTLRLSIPPLKPELKSAETKEKPGRKPSEPAGQVEAAPRPVYIVGLRKLVILGVFIPTTESFQRILDEKLKRLMSKHIHGISGSSLVRLSDAMESSSQLELLLLDDLVKHLVQNYIPGSIGLIVCAYHPGLFGTVGGLITEALKNETPVCVLADYETDMMATGRFEESYKGKMVTIRPVRRSEFANLDRLAQIIAEECEKLFLEGLRSL